MDDVRVSTIELFFDLVFVFTITQLTSVLVAEPTGAGLARVALVGQPLGHAHHRVAILVEVVQEHVALGPDEVGHDVVRHCRGT